MPMKDGTAHPFKEPEALFPFRHHLALGRCWCGRCHSIAEAIALNTEADS